MNQHFLLFIISAFIHDVIKGERVSVNDGGSVTLHTHTDLKIVGMIVWRFNGERIAKINIEDNDTPVYYDERFTDRLKMNPQTGDLTITNITSELTGEYQQEINGDLIIKSFSVKVKERFTDDGSSKGPSLVVIAGICVLVLLVIVAAADGRVIYRGHIKKPQDSSIEMGTHKPLRDGDTSNGCFQINMINFTNTRTF